MDLSAKQVILGIFKTSAGRHLAKHMYEDKFTAEFMDDDEILEAAIKAGFRDYTQLNRPINERLFDSIQCKDHDVIYCYYCANTMFLAEYKDTAEFLIERNRYVIVCSKCGNENLEGHTMTRHY